MKLALVVFLMLLGVVCVALAPPSWLPQLLAARDRTQGAATFMPMFVPIAARRRNPTTPTRVQSTWTAASALVWIGWWACWTRAAIVALINVAVAEPTKACVTSTGETPAIHIIVVVVSPTTEPAPPAFEAPMIAAR